MITRRNHFVPRFYLRRWSADGSTLCSYRLLVPHEDVPPWNRVPIKTLGARLDLYTEFVEGAELDDFEKWVKTEFEDPAVEPLNRVADGLPLTSADWNALALFFALQDVRTPNSLIESLKRWEKQLPALLENTLRESVAGLEAGVRKGETLTPTSVSHPLARSFRVEVDPDSAEAPPGMGSIRAEITPGRSLWLASMRQVLTNAAAVLQEHKWSLARPAPGSKWPTSDHPAVKLNYNGPKDYTFGGGWGSPGTELMLPLSPFVMMYTQIGHERPPEFQFSSGQTRELQKLLCERAHREIYSLEPSKRVTWARPRWVDRDAFAAEEAEWERWRTKQTAQERELEETNRGSV